MHFGFLYFTCGIIALSLAALFPTSLLIVVCSWTALCFFCVSLAYFFNNPSIFRKKIDGRIPFFVKVFFIPFLVIIHTYNKFARAFDGVPSIQSVEENLFIGDRLTSSDVQVMADKNIKAVLDVTAEFESLDWTLTNEKISYHNIPILDHSIPPDKELYKAVIWIKNQQRANGAVLVNCALGRGRSALVIAAYLLSQSDQKEISGTLRELKRTRSTVNLNKRQRKLLAKIIKEEPFHSLPKAWIIANPVSGGGKWNEYKSEIFQKLSQHYLLTVRESTVDCSVSQLAQEAVADSTDVIIACGGDGTVAEVASQIVDTEITLGIVPAGTTNALCHVLMGVKAKILPVETACNYIIDGKSRRIDTARCNDRLVLLLVGLGFEQKMIEAADRQAKDEYGQFAYLMGLWQAIQSSDVLSMTVSIDENEPFTLHTSSLVVANAAPLTTILAQGKGNPDHFDGLLDVTWIDTEKNQDNPIAGLLELAISGVFDVSSDYSIKHLHAKKIKISVDPESNYVIDGEVCSPDDLEISICPKSLRVFC